MTTKLLTPSVMEKLGEFLKGKKSCDLVTAYLYFIEQKFDLKPVVFPMGKMIYQSLDSAISKLEEEGKLWREAEIRIGYSEDAVNEETQKIYICPFTGKVFGDNTHPNPQDAIYDWVSKCPENTERVGGLRVKRFYVSEDPDVIKNYIIERKAPITKTVFSSAITGKLFNSKKTIVDDFKKSHTKPISLLEAQSQNRFALEESFVTFIQDQVNEERLAAFVEELAEHEEFLPYVEQWVDSDDEE